MKGTTLTTDALFFLCFVLILLVISPPAAGGHGDLDGGGGGGGRAFAAAASIARKSCADELLGQTPLHEDHECVISRVLATTPRVFSSSLEVRHQDAIPGSQAWARCQSCFWHRDHFEVIVIREDIEGASDSSAFADISWSQWGEFFHYRGHRDRLKTQILSITPDDLLSIQWNRELFQDTYIIDRPVFYIPMIAFHYGHLLIDVLEQVHGAMIDAYGETRSDALLLLDSANHDEREYLHQILDTLCNHNNESGGHFSLLLQWLTNVPITSVSHLFYGRRIYFTDLHLGADLTHSFFASGMKRQPCHFVSPDRHVQRLGRQYKAFRDHLWRQYLPAEWLALSDEEKRFTPSAPAEWDVLFIQRTGTRVIRNMQVLLDKAQELSLRAEVIELEKMPFSDQLAYLHFTGVVVAAAGTATHNMLFMRPGSAMVIVMQAEWCEWSWMYVNQGLLLGITVRVLCDDREEWDGVTPTGRSRHSSFVNAFWKQGPGGAKNSNVTVNKGAFEAVLTRLRSDSNKEYATQSFSPGDQNNDSWCLGSNEKSLLNLDIHHGKSNAYVADPELYIIETPRSMLMHPFSPIEKKRNTFQKLDRPFVRASIVTITLSHSLHPESTPINPSWLQTLAIQADITSHVEDMDQVFEFFPHLTVCSNMWLLPEKEIGGPFCVRADALNFHSTINTHLDLTQEELVIHMWFQVSEKGGKVKGSDCYVPVNLKLPNFGLIFSEARRDDSTTSSECVVYLSSEHQGLAEEGLIFSYTPTYRTSFQHATADFCRGYDLTDTLCYEAVHQISTCIRARATYSGLPNIQLTPTPQDPFVFLHFEKVGGTSLRELIYQSAIKNNLDFFIPCYNSVPDMTFSLPPPATHSSFSSPSSMKHMSVLAGHFQWGVWRGLPAFSPQKRRVRYGVGSSVNAAATGAAFNETDGLVPRVPSCFMMGRHPVDRLISYYYQRCYREVSCRLYQVRFSELSADDMYYIVVLFRQAKYLADGKTLMFSDDGTHDSMCRASLGERTTTGVLVEDVMDDDGSLPSPGDVRVEKHQQAIANMNKCVIGMLEEWDISKKMMKYWFPWMKIPKLESFSTSKVAAVHEKTNDGNDDIDESPHLMKLYAGKETVSTIAPTVRESIEELIPCDMKLYHNMLERFEKQKQHLANEGFVV